MNLYRKFEANRFFLHEKFIYGGLAYIPHFIVKQWTPGTNHKFGFSEWTHFHNLNQIGYSYQDLTAILTYIDYGYRRSQALITYELKKQKPFILLNMAPYIPKLFLRWCMLFFFIIFLSLTQNDEFFWHIIKQKPT